MYICIIILFFFLVNLFRSSGNIRWFNLFLIRNMNYIIDKKKKLNNKQQYDVRNDKHEIGVVLSLIALIMHRPLHLVHYHPLFVFSTNPDEYILALSRPHGRILNSAKRNNNCNYKIHHYTLNFVQYSNNITIFEHFK